jgi:hypothetical protein
MRRNKLIIVASAALIIILLVTIYLVQNVYSNNGKTAYSSVINGLQLSIAVNETIHRQGDTIFATLKLTNIDDHNVSTAFIDPTAYFELSIFDSENKLEEAAMGVQKFNTPIELAPKDSIDYTMKWLTDARYYHPQEGAYQFVGIIRDNSFQIIFRTAPLDITLSKEITTTPTS